MMGQSKWNLFLPWYFHVRVEVKSKHLLCSLRVACFSFSSISFSHRRTIGWIRRFNRHNKKRSKEAKVAIRRICCFRGFQL